MLIGLSGVLLLPGVVAAAADPPEPEDVKAGWTALVIFLLLIAAVVFLAFSLVKQLRKAQSAKDAGVYGDQPAEHRDD
jgi:heme/copper-type cytochrome/quinol oxidase subunit 2